MAYVDPIRSRIFFFCGNHGDSCEVWNPENGFRCGDSSEDDRFFLDCFPRKTDTQICGGSCTDHCRNGTYDDGVKSSESL